MAAKRDAERERMAAKIAEVVWVDTHCEHGWTNDVPEPGPIKSVGYVIRDDEEAVTLSESIDLVENTKRYGCLTSIPKNGVISVRYLKGKK